MALVSAASNSAALVNHADDGRAENGHEDGDRDDEDGRKLGGHGQQTAELHRRCQAANRLGGGACKGRQIGQRERRCHQADRELLQPRGKAHGCQAAFAGARSQIGIDDYEDLRYHEAGGYRGVEPQDLMELRIAEPGRRREASAVAHERGKLDHEVHARTGQIAQRHTGRSDHGCERQREHDERAVERGGAEGGEGVAVTGVQPRRRDG